MAVTSTLSPWNLLPAPLRFARLCCEPASLVATMHVTIQYCVV
jgi:hypothetical protein